MRSRQGVRDARERLDVFYHHADTNNHKKVIAGLVIPSFEMDEGFYIEKFK